MYVLNADFYGDVAKPIQTKNENKLISNIKILDEVNFY